MNSFNDESLDLRQWLHTPYICTTHMYTYVPWPQANYLIIIVNNLSCFITGCRRLASGSNPVVPTNEIWRASLWWLALFPLLFQIPSLLARILHELLSRDRRDGGATGLSQGLGPEAYLTVRRRVRGPRTPGRTTIFAVAADNSWNMRAGQIPCGHMANSGDLTSDFARLFFL